MPEDVTVGSRAAAVVVSYGDAVLHPATQRALANLETVVVVRNPRFAGDEAPAMGAFRTVTLDRNRGYAAAVNAGLAACAPAPLVLVITHDTVIEADHVAQLLSVAAATRDVGVVAPRLADDAGRVTSAGGTVTRFGRVRHLTVQRDDEMREVGWVDGAAFVVRRAALDAVGAFDEATFMYMEDVDFCTRVRTAGWAVAVCDEVTVAQRSGASSRPGAHAYLIVRNNIAFSRRVAGLPGLLSGSMRGVATAGLALLRPRSSTPGVRSRVRQFVGALWGVLDAWRRRVGPPPATLARWGDIRGTAP